MEGFNGSRRERMRATQHFKLPEDLSETTILGAGGLRGERGQRDRVGKKAQWRRRGRDAQKELAAKQGKNTSNGSFCGLLVRTSQRTRGCVPNSP